MRTNMKSLRMIRQLDRGIRHANASERNFYCWKMQDIGIKYTDDQQAKMCEAQQEMTNAETKVREVFAEMIGKQIVTEVAEGKWK